MERVRQVRFTEFPYLLAQTKKQLPGSTTVSICDDNEVVDAYINDYCFIFV